MSLRTDIGCAYADDETNSLYAAVLIKLPIELLLHVLIRLIDITTSILCDVIFNLF